MIPDIRSRYNDAFTPARYTAFLEDLHSLYPGSLDFRVAETPVFLTAALAQQMQDACAAIIETVQSPAYIAASERAIPPGKRVPGPESPVEFIAFDFGLCHNPDDGGITPQLIEMQGFPTLFAWHSLMPEGYARHFDIPAGYTPYLSGLHKETYLELLGRILKADAPPGGTVLLELLPHEQKTRVDFYATEQLLGIPVVCVTEVEMEGRYLYYRREGRRIRIERIYNRVIFDDLDQQSTELQEKAQFFFADLDVQWVPHPNHFYRLSKFTLPFIQHPCVPHTQFLSDVKTLPDDLRNYVLKPLFSFAGQGVIIDIAEGDIEGIRDPQNWILQRKVDYAPVVLTPDGGAKAEVRLFYFRHPDTGRYLAANNLARLSKGKMVGVRYNADKQWVGGSVALFPEGS